MADFSTQGQLLKVNAENDIAAAQCHMTSALGSRVQGGVLKFQHSVMDRADLQSLRSHTVAALAQGRVAVSLARAWQLTPTSTIELTRKALDLQVTVLGSSLGIKSKTAQRLIPPT